jgi:hypothetical protein
VGFTATPRIEGVKGPPNRWVLPWTSDSGGSFDDTTYEVITGSLVGIEIVSSSTARPNVNYSVQLFKESTLEMIGSLGSNINNFIPKYIVPGATLDDGTNQGAVPFQLNEKVRLVVSYAGSAKSGSVILYTR